MHICNGKTHTWSDDSYSQNSYPCPGPDKCADARARLAKESTINADEVTPDEIKDVFGYDEQAEKARLEARLKKLNDEREKARELARKEATVRIAEQRARLESFRPAADAEEESSTQAVIREVCDEFRDWLIAKNQQYGDSAIHPVRVFSSSSDEEQLLVRIDDKLSRLFRGNSAMEPDADIMDDLLGYWLLLRVLRRKAGETVAFN